MERGDDLYQVGIPPEVDQNKEPEVGITALRPISHRKNTLLNKNTVRASLVESKNQGNESKKISVSDRRNSSEVENGNHNAARTARVKSKSQGSVCKISSISDKQNSSPVQHDHNNAVKTSQIKSSRDTPTVIARGGVVVNIHTGKPRQSTQKSNDFMPPVKESGSHTTPSSGQVGQQKVKSQPSEKQSKVKNQPSEKPSKVKDFLPPVKESGSHTTSSSGQVGQKKVKSKPSEKQSMVKNQPSEKPSKVKLRPSNKPSKQPSKQEVPKYHIVWDGFDDHPTTQPFGKNCLLCMGDLSYSPTGEELEPSVLPDVAVLSCHHVFHCQCLQIFASEEQQSTDPSCSVCANGLS